ncbi:MAG: hypothetical protein LBF49_00420 [Puniceicoccales bacterium]|jgi:hypothetical protein|nr:hypothetical protein [Puniceicoccales bacterium]
MEKNMEKNTEISLAEHRKIEETLSYLVRPKAKIMFQGSDVCYVFSRKQYELLETHMGAMDMIARDTFIGIREDLNHYVSLCSKDDRVGDKIKDALGDSTIVFNAYKKMSKNLLRLMNDAPYKLYNARRGYTHMPAETYRLLILACIGYYGDMEWTRHSILRGDAEEEFTKKVADE